MPQIWLSYDELATLINCRPDAARAAALVLGLDRRRSRDGSTRVKLTQTLADSFIESVIQQRLDQQVRASAADLHAMRERMLIPSNISEGARLKANG